MDKDNNHYKYTESNFTETTTAAAPSNTATGLYYGKLWGYALTALSQFFILIFIPYIFATTSADHFFGIWAYQVADFFLSRLLGLTAFFIPAGCFLVGCYYLFEKQEIGDLVRKIFITAVWFFMLNVFLLSWSGLEASRLAGLFPRFFHALLDHIVSLQIAKILPPVPGEGDLAAAQLAAFTLWRKILLIFIEGGLFLFVTWAIARTYTISLGSSFALLRHHTKRLMRWGLRIVVIILKYVLIGNAISKAWHVIKTKITTYNTHYHKRRATAQHSQPEEPFMKKTSFSASHGKEPFIRRERSPVFKEKDQRHHPTSLAATGGNSLDHGESEMLSPSPLASNNGAANGTAKNFLNQGNFLDLTQSPLFNTNTLARAVIKEEAKASFSSSSAPDSPSDRQANSIQTIGDIFQENKIQQHGFNGATSSPGGTVDNVTTDKMGGLENYFGVRIINRDENLFAARMNCLADMSVLRAAEFSSNSGSNSTISLSVKTPVSTARATPTSGGAMLKHSTGEVGRFDKNSRAEMLEVGKLLEQTFKDFGIDVEVVHVESGPVITCYELKIEPGVRLARIMNLADNLALALAAPSVRIVAPIPGKAVIGIEIPNRERQMVTLSEIVESVSFAKSAASLPISLGASILGAPVISDLTTMPHLLVAGATGSGKSVLINALISSLILSLSPNEIRFLMVDPKMVELNVYNGIPHLLVPVISDPKEAALSLKWLINEMEARYRLLEYYGVRSLHSYHELLRENRVEQQGLWAGGRAPSYTEDKPSYEGNSQDGTMGKKRFVKGSLPYIVVLIDEFADLMMTARKDVEDSLSRLAAMSRAVGIHLILATQRPSVDVITGVIKANFPSRVAFQVSSKIDSRTIIDGSGAEKLLGKGDMLFQSASSLAPRRIQGAFLSDNEVSRLIETLKSGTNSYILDNVHEMFDYGDKRDKNSESTRDGAEIDVLFEEALALAKQDGKVSASYLQRRLRIGYNRAARLIETMQEKGYISSPNGVKPRDVLVS
ncbi:DNA translocase FtsK [Spirochaetota bacterium]|nr:DNA translocase FtsK [Spirochaetota bacterium]